MHDEKRKAIKLCLGLSAMVFAMAVAGLLRVSGAGFIGQERQVPRLVTPYDRVEIADPAERALRKVRDQHYERFVFGMPSLDLVGGGEHTDCYAPGVRERLAIEKDTVLIGGILDAHVYLNATRQHVYTEYRVHVETILKVGSDVLSPGKEIVTGRWGGAIRFPSGEIREYSVRKLGMPEVGKRYLFFLEEQKDGGDFYIWTAFRLSSDSVTEIDELDSKLFPLAAYKGSSETEFLSKVRKALSRQRAKIKRESTMR